MPATKSVSKNIKNLKTGAHHGKRVADQGKEGARKQEIAIAYAEAKKAGAKGVKPKAKKKKAKKK